MGVGCVLPVPAHTGVRRSEESRAQWESRQTRVMNNDVVFDADEHGAALVPLHQELVRSAGADTPFVCGADVSTTVSSRA